MDRVHNTLALESYLMAKPNSWKVLSTGNTDLLFPELSILSTERNGNMGNKQSLGYNSVDIAS